MSVIGYDGRIRPASTPFNAGTPNKLDPEAVGRIGEAQPKFAEYATKLINSLGGNAIDYGKAKAQKEKRMEDLQDRETVMNERQSIEEQKRVIQNSKTLTAEEKEWAGKNIVVRKYDTGNEERNKRIELDIKGAAFNAMNSIIADAERMKDAADAAALGAFEAEAAAKFKAYCEQIRPELLNAKDLDGLTVNFEQAFNDWFANAEKGRTFSPQDKAKYDLWKARVKASEFGQAASALNQKKLSDAKRDLTNIIASVSVDSVSADEVGLVASEAVSGERVKNLFSNVEKQEMVNAAVLNYSQNTLNELNASVSTSTMAAQKSATSLLESGDVSGYNDAMRQINDFVVGRYTTMISQLEGDEDAALRLIRQNKNISDSDRSALTSIVKDKYNKLRESAKSKMASEVESFRRDSEASKKAAGTAAGKALQKALRGEAGVKLDSNAIRVYDLLRKGDVERDIVVAAKRKQQAGEAFSEEELAIINKKPNEMLARRFEELYAPQKPEKQRGEFVLLGFESAIINATQDTEGNYNLLEVESVLNTCGEVYGYTSNEYGRIARMAIYAIKDVKNGEKETIDSWIQKDVYGKKTQNEWVASASHEQIRALNNLKLRLQETPKEQLEDTYKLLMDEFKTAEKFRILETGEVFADSYKRAKSTAGAWASVHKAGEYDRAGNDSVQARLFRSGYMPSASHILGAPSLDSSKAQR